MKCLHRACHVAVRLRPASGLQAQHQQSDRYAGVCGKNENGTCAGLKSSHPSTASSAAAPTSTYACNTCSISAKPLSLLLLLLLPLLRLLHSSYISVRTLAGGGLEQQHRQHTTPTAISTAATPAAATIR
jgi:hypothetical protein